MSNSNRSDLRTPLVAPGSFYFDISGQSFQKTILGYVALTDAQRGIFSRLRESGRQLLTTRKLRVSKHDISLIHRVLLLLHEENIAMTAISVSPYHWQSFKASFQNYMKWEERAYAYFYFEGFRHVVPPHRGFNVFLDQDSFFDLQYAIDRLHFISKSNSYYPSISVGQARYVEPLRLADVVCRAVRNMPIDELSEYGIKVFSDPSDKRVLNRLFPARKEA